MKWPGSSGISTAPIQKRPLLLAQNLFNAVGRADRDFQLKREAPIFLHMTFSGLCGVITLCLLVLSSFFKTTPLFFYQ